MAFGIDIKGIGDILSGAGALAKDVRSAITGEISPEKKAELAIKAQEMELALSTAQTRINEIEAGSSKLFVAAWRPMVGWICAAGLFYGTIGKPFIEFLARVFGYQGAFPEIDADTLNTTLFGMLGLGVMRTAEKIKGAAGNH
jgi:roadblock/LC7 domain-containing protein